MENLKSIVEQCETYKQVIQCLGLNINGTNYSKVKKMISDNKLSTNHFLSSSEFMKKYGNNKEVLSMSKILIENSNYPRGSLKKRLVREKLIEYKCKICENKGEWMGKKISLILDHINGVNNDNRLENLRFLCPNCEATLDTHCGGNVKNKKNKKIPLKPINFNILKNKHLRKVNRPSLEILLNDVSKIGYVATGKKYGVSDNTIRKWIKVYEIEKLIT